MDGRTGMIILYVLIGFFTFILVTGGTIIAVLWRRRKYIFTNFLSDNGQWERQSWLPDKIGDTFTYDNQTYKFDIKKTTRDKINRPIAHYYKGNPEQQVFNYAQGNKKINIGTKELTGKDFHVLMLSKVLRDIFQDEEVMNMLWTLLFVVVGVSIITWIIVFARNPPCSLEASNETLNIIAQGVKQGIMMK